jgi:hypothetical protein
MATMSNISGLAGVAGLYGLGYFTEIELLQNRISDLQAELQKERVKREEERAEYRDIYARLREDCTSNQRMFAEIQFLKSENAKMAAELHTYHKTLSAQILQAAIRRKLVV